LSLDLDDWFTPLADPLEHGTRDARIIAGIRGARCSHARMCTAYVDLIERKRP
jgi:hypothetical protein